MMRDILDIRMHKEFEDLCHELLAAEYPDYQPIAGEGGDEGIDGFRSGRSVIYQLKFSTQRARPTEYFADLDRVVTRGRLDEWVLVINRDPTPRLLALAEEKATQYSIRVVILGRTRLKALTDKHPKIRKKYFQEVAKEATVLRLYDHVASKSDLRQLQKEIRSKRPPKVHSTPPPGSLTQDHQLEITDAAQGMVRNSRGKVPYRRVFAMLKNKFHEKNWHCIPDKRFPEVMNWMHNFTYGVRDEYDHRDSATRLKGVIQSQRRALHLTEQQYRDLLTRLTDLDSTTKMDLRQLRFVRDHFNLLIERTHRTTDT